MDWNTQTPTFPSWHFSMLNDRQRNHALKLCIESLDLKSKTIFEIGTGAELTALILRKQVQKDYQL